MKWLGPVFWCLLLACNWVLAHDGAHKPAEAVQEDALRESITAYEKRLAKNPTDINALVQLGDRYERLGRMTGEHQYFQKATKSFGRILDMVPDHHGALKGWCRSEMARHHFQKALQVARRLSDSYPQEVSSWLLLGDAHFFLGHYTEAETMFMRAHRAEESLATVSRLAQIQEFRGHYPKAKTLMTEALGLAGNLEKGAQERAWVLTMLAEMELKTHNINAALDYFQRALKEDGATLYAKWRMAAIYRHQGSFDSARKLLHDLVHARPKINYLVSYGDIWQDLDRADRAKYWHEKAIANVREDMKASDFGHVRELVAHWSNQGTNLEEALKLAEREYKDIRQDAEGAEWLGWLHHLNGHPEKAAAYVDVAFRQGLATPRFLMRAALVHHKAGHHLRAAHLLKLGYHPEAFVSKKLLKEATDLKKWLEDNPGAVRAEFRANVAKNP